MKEKHYDRDEIFSCTPPMPSSFSGLWHHPPTGGLNKEDEYYPNNKKLTQMKERTTTVKTAAKEAAAARQIDHPGSQRKQAEPVLRDRKTYCALVDDEIDRAVHLLKAVSAGLRSTKSQIIEQFRDILRIKSEMTAAGPHQRSHTFTNSAGTSRITLGVYCKDDYDETARQGVSMVRQYLEGIAGDEKSKTPAQKALRLLEPDAHGSLRAGRVHQLHKLALQSGDEGFMEGVRIIQQAYRPADGRRFIRAEVKDTSGVWKSIPLGLTES